jgi:hypothetical protein
MDWALIALFVLAFVASGVFVTGQVRSLRVHRAQLLAQYKDPRIVNVMMRDYVAQQVKRHNQVPRWLAVIVLLISLPALCLGIAFWWSGPEMMFLTLVFGGLGLYGTVNGVYMLLTGNLS